jgi:DNA-binding NtrC family response regulator
MQRHTLLVSGIDNDTATEGPWREMVADYAIVEAESLAALQAALESHRIDCVLLMGSVVNATSLEVLEMVHLRDSSVPVIVRDAKLTAAEAVRLIRAGAAHCFDPRDGLALLREAVDRAIEEKRFLDKTKQRRAGSPESWREILIGESLAMETVAETIRLVGPRRCTVLIGGETGTGKEMAARALHMASPRAQARMVAINCSALPENLLEAELFGHTRGAFTGAISNRIGRFEQAGKSTLFLDEIGDMPLELQAKLLRVLQDREIQRLGSSETIKVDVRIIAASNVDLAERVRQGKFREDLYYRLNVVPLQMPPLRKRTNDIPMLVSHFVKKVCQAEGIELKRLVPEALNRLCSQPWPGNVRQLENAVEMAMAVSGDRDLLYPKDFGLANAAPVNAAPQGIVPPMQVPAPGTIDFDTAVTQFELAMLDQALRQTGGNKTMAAERLGIKRTTLIMKIRNMENAGLLLTKAS